MTSSQKKHKTENIFKHIELYKNHYTVFFQKGSFKIYIITKLFNATNYPTRKSRYTINSLQCLEILLTSKN